MLYNLVSHGDAQSLTLFHNDEMFVADNNHPNWTAILQAVLVNDETVTRLFDTAKAVQSKFDVITDRVSVRGNALYFDGDPITGVLVDQILSFLNEGLDFNPLIAFLENVQQNPQRESRDALFSWLEATGGFGITDEGLIVGYKGVNKNSDGTFWSTTSGHAIVDGVEVNGLVPNRPGSRVTMPRNEVAFDRNQACSTGLHIGTWDYASRYADTTLQVLVNPRDVVSVPFDSGAQKIRACAYTVVGPVDKKDDNLLASVFTGDELPAPPEEEYEDDEPTCVICGDEAGCCYDDYCDDCGDEEEEDDEDEDA